jgi:hypothetical protein
MYFFLNRNKTPAALVQHDATSNAQNIANPKLVDDAKKTLYDSIILRRTDIAVSLLNEWLKGFASFYKD